MANPAHTKVVQEGSEAIRHWRKDNHGHSLNLTNAVLTPADLSNADLSQADLSGATLEGANLNEANLSKTVCKHASFRGTNLRRAVLSGAKFVGADFRDAILREADVSGANLSRANLTDTDLSHAILIGTDFSEAKLYSTILCAAHLQHANFSDADIYEADFSKANLSGSYFPDARVADTILHEANLSGAHLVGARFHHCAFYKTAFHEAICGGTAFVAVNLGIAEGLDSTRHESPSDITISSLQRSEGKIPESFLEECGFSSWETGIAQLYDPRLSPADVAEYQQRIFDERTKGYFLSGLFVSYSHPDGAFVEKLYGRLRGVGANVWLDSRHAIAGPLERQVQRAIRLNDVFLLVLSRSSLASDWVEAELEWARRKEKIENREILCPVALDDAWKQKVESSVLWRTVKEKNILDFSDWESNGFEVQFQKLFNGLKVWYGTRDQIERSE